MGNHLLSISEAAELIGKSTQTIRRMVRGKKIKFRRKKTPQGFTYHIDKESLLAMGGIEPTEGLEKPDLTEAEKPLTKKKGKKKAEVKEAFVDEGDIFNLDAEAVKKVKMEKEGLKKVPAEKGAEKQDDLGGETVEIEIDDEEPAVDFSELMEESDKAKKSHISQENPELINQKKATNQQAEKSTLETERFELFNQTVQQMMTQYEHLLKNQEEDKQRLFKLVETFQDRIGILENRIRQLEAPKKKRWYQFWK